MSVLAPGAKTDFHVDRQTARPMSMRSAMVLWLASSALLWIGVIEALRTLI
jgi:hypothetical protein